MITEVEKLLDIRREMLSRGHEMLKSNFAGTIADPASIDGLLKLVDAISECIRTERGGELPDVTDILFTRPSVADQL